jgi:hypothetical protein
LDPVTVIVSVLVPMMVRVIDPEEVGVLDIDTEPVVVRVAVVVLDRAIVPVSVRVPWTDLVILTL